MDSLDLKIFFIIFAGLFMGTMVVKIILFKRRTRINPITYNKNYSRLNAFMEQMLVVVLLAWLGVLSFFIWDEPLFRLFDFWFADSVDFQSVGMGLAIAGFGTIVIAISQMHDAWRIGIDEIEPQNEVVNTGLFRYIKHPTYLGMIFIVFGFFLILPNVLTAMLLPISVFGSLVQMKIEEDFMIRLHSERYADYAAQCLIFFRDHPASQSFGSSEQNN
jgi:protein-S-isoprenylcysteine O-methyltransferase Ste14